MKDYIEIINKDNSKTKMEIVSIFKLDNYSSDYIIYKELDGSHYYIAKYKGDNIVDLDTDFSVKEMELAKILLNEIIHN